MADNKTKVKNLLRYSEVLKHLPRTGWLQKGIEQPESVAAHSWQMALLALFLSSEEDSGYDFDRVIKLCLCHDMAESKIGDITPTDGAYSLKASAEKAAMAEIAAAADFPALNALWQEYEAGQTPEALLARDLDKLDMYAQSLDYEQKFPGKDLSEFRRSAATAIKTVLGKKLLAEINRAHGICA